MGHPPEMGNLSYGHFFFLGAKLSISEFLPDCVLLKEESGCRHFRFVAVGVASVREARSIKAELMEEEAEDSDDEEYQLLGIDFGHGMTRECLKRRKKHIGKAMVHVVAQKRNMV